MSEVYIDLITNVDPRAIAFVDITLMHQSDSTKNQHVINPTIHRELDFTDGVRVAHFNGLQNESVYRIVLYLVSNGGLLLGRVITEVLETGNRNHAVSIVVSID